MNGTPPDRRDRCPTGDGQRRRRKAADEKPPRRRTLDFFRENLSSENIKTAAVRALGFAADLAQTLRLKIFYSRERILCGGVLALLMVFFAMVQTTIFSTIRPFGCSPDLMISFVLALSVTERRRWGAVWGLLCAVLMDSLGSYSVSLLPLLYVIVGYFGGVIANHYLTGSAAVRAILEVGAVILRCIFTAVLAYLSPLYATAGEIFFDIVLPEAAATLLLAAPVQLITYICMRPFHRTRDEKVS